MKLGSMTLILLFSSVANSQSIGSGGTTGGNPKPISAVPFHLNSARAAKLAAAADLLRQRLPKNCFPKEYNQAVLAEMENLLAEKNIFYFPAMVLLGHDRYAGDYGSKVLPNGNHQFFEVGAFTQKLKGAPVYFTQDSDNFNTEELAMTFAQDLNDHVLQWSNESHLNVIGAMAMGRETCKPNAPGASQLYSTYPSKEIEFNKRKQDLLSHLQNLKKRDGVIRFGAVGIKFETDRITETRDGFIFTPTSYLYWPKDGYVTVPAKNPKPLEVVLNPFQYVKEEFLVDSEDSLNGIIRDPESRTIITEFSFNPRWGEKDIFVMDPMCSTREFSANDAIRHEISDAGGRFNTYNSCSMNVIDGKMELTIHRNLNALCDEHKAYDFFSFHKTIDDYARETFCRTNNQFSKDHYRRYLGKKTPDGYLQDLIAANEKHIKRPWLTKRILGGELSMLGDGLAVIRDEKGDLHSLFVSARGVFLTAENVEDPQEDDDDEAYQCFFKGPLAGTCNQRYYED